MMCLFLYFCGALTKVQESLDAQRWTSLHPGWSEDLNQLAEKGMALLLYRYVSVRSGSCWDHPTGAGLDWEYRVAQPATGIPGRCRCLMYLILLNKLGVEIGIAILCSGYIT